MTASDIKEVIRENLTSERIAIMGSISRVIDRLPMWAKLISVALTVLGSMYRIARYGFLSFLLHVIFIPLSRFTLTHYPVPRRHFRLQMPRPSSRLGRF